MDRRSSYSRPERAKNPRPVDRRHQDRGSIDRKKVAPVRSADVESVGPVGKGVVIALVVALVLQATALLGRGDGERHHTWSGVLALTAAAASGMALWLFSTGRLVIVRALGAMIIDGRAHLVLRLFVALFPLGSAILIESARAARGRIPRSKVIIATGLLVGVLTACQVAPLSDGAHSGPALYAYDMWSPLALCWMGVCLVEWILVILEFRSRPFTLWVAALPVSGFALLAWKHPRETFLGDHTGAFWHYLLIVAWMAAFALGVRFGALTFFWKFFEKRRWRRAALWTLVIAIGAASLRFLVVVVSSSSVNVGVAAAITGAILLAFVVGRLALLYRTDMPILTSAMADLAGATDGGAPVTEVQTGNSSRVASAKMKKIFALVLLPAIFLVVWLSGDLFYLMHWPATLDLAGLDIAAIVLIELTSEGPLKGAAPTLASAVWGQNSYVRAALIRLLGTVRLIGKFLVAPLERLVAGSVVSRTIGKLLLLVTFLVVLQELPNRGRTLVHQFSSHSLPPEKTLLGEVVSERIANEMAALTSELRTEMLVTPTRDKFEMVPIGAAKDFEASLQDDSLAIGPMKIPLGAFLSPLRSPMQSLVGARVITGSLQEDSEGGYHLLVGASTGETWHVSTGPGASSPATAATAALLQKVDELAYHVVSSDPAWSRAGMTILPDSFADFRQGLADWRDYTDAESYEDRVGKLKSAIGHFGEAVAKDPTFAVAHYRLGLALRSDNQPAAAIREFSQATTVNGHFGPAENALASTLFDFQSFLPPLPASVPFASDRAAFQDASKFRLRRARRIWDDLVSAPSDVVSVADIGSAYLGLCRATLTRDDGTTETEGRGSSDRMKLFAAAYYLCARADAIYASLPTLRSRSIAVTRAETLTGMAIALMRAGDTGATGTTSLGCDGAQATLSEESSGLAVQWRVPSSHFHDEALLLAAKARALVPDDAGIACTAATLDQVAGHDRLMQHVARTAGANLQMGQAFLTNGEQLQSTDWLRLALERFDDVVKIDPDNLDALNYYAYTFWVLRYISGGLHLEEYQSIGLKAETYARRAVRLASERTSASTRAMYDSTLGEVLMALGRPHEAIDVLKMAVKEAPVHSRYDEIRWDLAQAYACARYTDRRDETLTKGTRCEGLSDKAATLYQEILEHEQTREFQVYSGMAPDLDPERPPAACIFGLYQSLRTVTFKPSDCRRSMAVSVSTDYHDARVHIWGRGVDALASSESQWRVFLSAEPVETHHQYFAQVVDSDGEKPLTPAFSFPTHRDPKKNLIVLEIHGPLRAGADRSPVTRRGMSPGPGRH